jgi:hypothetical protein
MSLSVSQASQLSHSSSSAERRTRYAARLAAWSPQADLWQFRIPFDDPHEFRDILRRQVEDGSAKLCELTRDGEPIGMLLYRVEEYAARELVIIAAYSSDRSIDWSDWLAAFLENLGRGLQCGSVRFHTLRPGLVENAIRHGYRAAEIILRKVL